MQRDCDVFKIYYKFIGRINIFLSPRCIPQTHGRVGRGRGPTIKIFCFPLFYRILEALRRECRNSTPQPVALQPHDWPNLLIV